jgi:hypothetical protein
LRTLVGAGAREERQQLPLETRRSARLHWKLAALDRVIELHGRDDLTVEERRDLEHAVDLLCTELVVGEIARGLPPAVSIRLVPEVPETLRALEASPRYQVAIAIGLGAVVSEGSRGTQPDRGAGVSEIAGRAIDVQTELHAQRGTPGEDPREQLFHHFTIIGLTWEEIARDLRLELHSRLRAGHDAAVRRKLGLLLGPRDRARRIDAIVSLLRTGHDAMKNGAHAITGKQVREWCTAWRDANGIAASEVERRRADAATRRKARQRSRKTVAATVPA